MFKEIFYNNNKAYLILRRLSEYDLDPKIYGINSNDRLKVLKAWLEWHGGDHALKKGDEYLICETIEDAEVIDNWELV